MLADPLRFAILESFAAPSHSASVRTGSSPWRKDHVDVERLSCTVHGSDSRSDRI